MYAVSEDRLRGTSRDQSGREFPVLFHLMDVSRPRVNKQTPSIDSANLLNAVEQLRRQPADEIASSPPEAAAPESPDASIPMAATPETPPVEPQPAAPAIASSATPEPAAEAPTDEQPAAEHLSAEQPAAPAGPPSPPPPAPLITLRKKPRTSASEDWFASHGKFIAVAFVLALIATIYFARVNRERASVAKQEAPVQPSQTESNSAIASGGQSAPSPRTETQAVQTASAAAPSPVELRAPQLVAQPSSDKARDNLFEFAAAKNADDRIAARPDDASKNAAPALTAPAFTTPSQPATPEIIATPAPQAAASTAPAETSAYPVTSSPATHYPVSIPPGSAYPATSPAAAPVLAPPSGGGYQPQPQLAPPAAPPVDYRSQYPVTPAPTLPQQPAWQGGNAGQPASYQPYDTTARGPRNERTGSGTY